MSKRSIKQTAKIVVKIASNSGSKLVPDKLSFCGEGNNGLNFLNEKLKMKQKFCCKIIVFLQQQDQKQQQQLEDEEEEEETQKRHGHAWRRYKQKRFLKEPLVGTARGALKKFNQQNVTAAVAAFSLLGSLSRRSVGSGCRLVVHFSRPFPTHMLGNA